MENKIMEEVQFHYNVAVEKGYEPLFTALYGSQNYHINTSESDVDTKTLICPSFKDLVDSSRTVCNSACSTGIMSLIDFREMFKMYYKGSINFVETLFTPYVIISPEWRDAYFFLRSYRERIARMNPMSTIHAAAGHAHNAAQYSNTKSVANVLRLEDFIKRFVQNEESYNDILVPSNLERIREIRNGKWENNYTVLVANSLKNIESIVDRYKKIENKVDELMAEILKEFSYKLMRRVMEKYV